jgi:hypothetical protein
MDDLILFTYYEIKIGLLSFLLKLLQTSGGLLLVGRPQFEKHWSKMDTCL